MKKLQTAATVLALTLCFTASAHARPKYFEKLKEAYPANAAAAAAKCALCHGAAGAKKKVLSEYGQELGAALGQKNVKDDDAVKKALETAGEKESKKGTTYDSILKDGKLPAPAP